MKGSLVIAMIMLVGLIGLIGYHEQTHVEIYRSYGIESSIEYFSHFPSVVTIAEEPCPNESCVLAHNNADSIMYPIGVIYIIFIFIFMEIIFCLEDIIRELKLSNRSSNG